MRKWRWEGRGFIMCQLQSQSGFIQEYQGRRHEAKMSIHYSKSMQKTTLQFLEKGRCIIVFLGIHRSKTMRGSNIYSLLNF